MRAEEPGRHLISENRPGYWSACQKAHRFKTFSFNLSLVKSDREVENLGRVIPTSDPLNTCLSIPVLVSD